MVEGSVVHKEVLMAKQAASRPTAKTAGAESGAPSKTRKKSVRTSNIVGMQHEPSHAEIAERAYGLYLARGAHEGDAQGDWARAESELRTLH
jgi:predicted signal transduction protein with EAL and GGDEF domain